MSRTQELLYGGKPLRFKLDSASGGATLTLDDQAFEISALELNAGRLLLRTGNGHIPARVVRDRDRVWVWLAGRVYEFQHPSRDEGGAGHAAEKHDDVRAPMPGTLVKLLVKAGDAVEEGQIVAVVEAMKMEHALRAPRTGVVGSTGGTPGSIVDAGAPIVILEPEEK